MKIDLDMAFKHIDWLKFKLAIDSTDCDLFPRSREIWWASLGQNIGVEMNGKNDKFERPVLVIKAFNAESFLVAPISSKFKNNSYLIEFVNQSLERNVIIVSQLRTVSIKRFLRKAGEMKDCDFNKAIEEITMFLNKTKIPPVGEIFT